MRDWSRGEIQFFALDRFDERYGCYRLPAREAEADMVSSLRQFGQLSPVVCRWQEEVPSLIDGFRRLHAARQIAGLGGLTTRLIEIDDREAKVAMYRLNLVGRRVHVLEEAWLVYALVREDGLSQLEVAQLMGRHKSWVCRRLALLEKLAAGAALEALSGHHGGAGPRRIAEAGVWRQLQRGQTGLAGTAPESWPGTRTAIRDGSRRAGADGLFDVHAWVYPGGAAPRASVQLRVGVLAAAVSAVRRGAGFRDHDPGACTLGQPTIGRLFTNRGQIGVRRGRGIC